jgi:hypothetical protein
VGKIMYLKLTMILLFLCISLTVVFAVVNPVYVNHGERYFSFQIRDKAELQTLTRMISIDNVKDNTVYAYANQKEWDSFNKLSYKITPLYHPSTLIDPGMSTNDRDIWSFDTYPSYDQYVTMMNTFATNYPNLCQIYELSTLASGRKILFAHISSNIATPAAKPEVMYTSSMHGDEVTGYILMLRLINTLLTQYGTDSRLTAMVNNLDIWINPVANPDGTYAGGNSSVSGATRGNANGIDLNRNFRDPVTGYPATQQPETILYQNFALSHHFIQVANFHGGAEVCNYPWDVWTSSVHTHPDNAWFFNECTAYAVAAKSHNSSYMTDVVSSGVTEGGDWYVVNGGRQDFTTYFAHGREVTYEVSSTKMPIASTMPTYWTYNYESLLTYLECAYYGIRGTVTNGSGTGLTATITVSGHDAYNSEIITDPTFGDYYRMIAPGTWTLVYSATGYQTKTISNISVASYTSVVTQNVIMDGLNAPLNLIATPGDGVVNLSWSAPSPVPSGGYRIYRNNVLYTTLANTITTYSDTGVTNGTPYSYYVKALYNTPIEESPASNTVNATPGVTNPTQVISLTSGWNLMSLDVHPTSMAPANVFSTVIANLLQVKNLTQTYDPALPSYLNTLTSLTDGQGYWVRMNSTSSLSLTAPAVNPTSTTIHLNTGWNLIGFTPQASQAIATSLSGIMSYIIQVKSLTQSYDPSLPSYLNTLTNLVPGKGYWAKVNAACDLVYPSSKSGNNDPSIIYSETPIPDWQPVIYPNNSATLYGTVEINCHPAEQGDIVGAFINNECVSVSEVQINDGIAYVTLVINMPSDEATASFKVYDYSVDQVVDITSTASLSAGGVYGNDGLVALETAICPTDDPTAQAPVTLSQNYPNPFNPNTSIIYNLKNKGYVELSVYNVKGDLVRSLVQGNDSAGSHTVSWNGTDNCGKNVASGLYFYKVKSGSFTSTKKMILIK